MAAVRVVRAAYRKAFGGQSGGIVLADMAAYAATAGDGAGRLIAYIVSVMQGRLLERAQEGTDEEA